MRCRHHFMVLLLFSIASTIVAVSSQVLVQCDNNVTVCSDTSVCWREGSMLLCNSLEEGMKEAGRLGTSLLVENISRCTSNNRSGGELYEDKCLSTSALTAQSNATSLMDNGLSSHQGSKHHQNKHKYRSSVTDPRVGAFTFPMSSCPPGFILTGSVTGTTVSSYDNLTSCRCLEGVRGIVKCASIGGFPSAFIRSEYCMTYDRNYQSIHVSSCKLSCPVMTHLLDGYTDYYILPNNVSHLDTIMCGKLNRQGFLCSECSPGYRAPAYSYSAKCVRCDLSSTTFARNWTIYLLLAVLPYSILVILMVVFRVSVTRPPFISMIHIFQAIAIPQYLQAITRSFTCWTYSQNTGFVIAVRLFMVFYGFFNIDFFRFIIPDFCLNLDTTQLLLLEYVPILWPLLLIFGAYLLVKLHELGFKPVVWVWKPVHYCLRHYRQEWHLASSLIEAFASFLFLSWTKLLSISSHLLKPLIVFTVTGDGNISTSYKHLSIAPSVRYFSGEHILPGIITILVLVVLILVPLLLQLMYPLRVFRHIIRRCGLHSRALQVFLDSFQGSLRNGTDGSTDCRWFASSYLITRIFFILLGTVFESRFYFPIASVALVGLAIGIYALQPYKKPIHSKFNSILILILAAFYICHGAVTVAEFASPDGYLTPSIGVMFLLGILPLAISVGYALWWIMKVKLSGVKLFPRVRQWWQQRRAEFEESVPDRVDNPQDYQEMELVLTNYEEYI